MNQHTGGGDAVAEISGAVATWVENVGRFLGVIQVALEESTLPPDAREDVRALVGQLPALVRECRAQAPTPEMIQTWVRSLAEAEADTRESLGAAV